MYMYVYILISLFLSDSKFFQAQYKIKIHYVTNLHNVKNILYFIINLTILLSVVTVTIYHGAIWPLSPVDAADGDSRWCSNGPLDIPLGPAKMKYSEGTMESTTTNPQGCSITRTSIALPPITKPHLRAKLENTHYKLLCAATLSEIMFGFIWSSGGKRLIIVTVRQNKIHK